MTFFCRELVIISADDKERTINIDDVVVAAGVVNHARLSPDVSPRVQSRNHVRVWCGVTNVSTENVKGGVNVNDGLCAELAFQSIQKVLYK